MTVADAPALSFSSVPGRWVVAVTVLGSGIAALDATVVDIALPAIGREFHVGVGALQWVMAGYSLALAAFLLIGGSLGDRFGRRRVYLIGVVWFTLASAACGFARPGVPDATRVLQGAGAALLAPGSLAILEASFVPADRGRAIGAWSGLSGVAVAAGPLIGGCLISAGSWRWIFFINVPVAAAVVALGARHVPESRDPGATGTDRLRGCGGGSGVADRRHVRLDRGAGAGLDLARGARHGGSSPRRGWPPSGSASTPRHADAAAGNLRGCGSSPRPTP